MPDPYPHFLPDLWQEMNGLACRSGWTPSRLRRFFLLMLRGHWSVAENHTEDLRPSLGCLAWNPDPQLSSLPVELLGTSVSTPPHAVWVAVGNYNFAKSVIGNVTGKEYDNATIYRTLVGSCQLLVRHDAPALDLAYDMAWSSLAFLTGMTESILDAMNGEGQDFEPQVMGDPIRSKEDPKETFRVDVGCRLGITLGVATTEESHRLAIVANQLLPQ